MKLQTSSETISFAKELEAKSAKFYEDLAQKYSKDTDILLGFGKENKKYANQIQMAYQSVISDAIEGCYAFDLNSDNYILDTELTGLTSYSDSLKKAIVIEEVITKFYDVAAKQSMSLMADVPRNFVIISKKRKNRILKLKSLI